MAANDADNGDGIRGFIDPNKPWESQAFKEWWETDYSWEGLAQKRQDPPALIEFDSPKPTIQDYWRDVGFHEGDLVEFAGRTWTRYHLPLWDLQGNPSPKATWSDEELREFVIELVLLTQTATKHEDKERNNSREYDIYGNQGMVRPVVFFDGIFVPRWFTLLSGQKIQSHIRFEQAWFQEYVGFMRTTFHGTANFRRAVFMDFAFFKGANFQRGANFDGAAFQKTAEFRGAIFQGVALFPIDVRESSGWQFEVTASFREFVFQGSAEFYDAIFEGDVTFASTVFKSLARFWYVYCKGHANFWGVTFWKGADFPSVIIRGKATFEEVNFYNDAFLANCAFFGSVNCRGAKFHDQAIFSVNLVAEPGKSDPTLIRSGSFANATFNDFVTFENRTFVSGVSFDDTRFNGLPVFHGAKLHQGMSFHGARFSHHGERLGSAKSMRARMSRMLHWPLIFLPWQERDRLAEKYEDAYRTLKQAMSDVQARTDEAEFFGHELRARLNRRNISLLEKLYLLIYQGTTGFGQSLTLSTLWLLGWQPLMMGLYAWFDAKWRLPTVSKLVDPDIWQFAVQQTTRPFSVWSEFYKRYPADWAKPYFCPTEHGFDPDKCLDGLLTLKLLATLHSFGVIVLTFLFLIVLRRRFQMH